MPKVKETRGELLRRCARDDPDFTTDGTIPLTLPLTGKIVKEKLHFVLERNPDWKVVQKLAKTLRGEPCKGLNFTPAEAASLKYLPLVSADVERSFSALKLLVTDLRKSLKTENIERMLVI